MLGVAQWVSRFQVTGLGVDEAELGKHLEKATREESVEA